MLIKDQIARLKKMNPEAEIASSIWTTDDVFSQAESIDVEITEEQAVEVIRIVQSKQDASIGINWEVIETHIYGVTSK